MSNAACACGALLSGRAKRCVECRYNAMVVRSQGCWDWRGAKSKGYGCLCVDGRMVGAHRISWQLTRGEIPDGLHVLHRCDNPPCSNPDHLFIGTASDNMLDAVTKGRKVAPNGERQGLSVLTSHDVLAIRTLLEAGESQRHVARVFSVAQATISSVKRNRTWRHLLAIEEGT